MHLSVILYHFVPSLPFLSFPQPAKIELLAALLLTAPNVAFLVAPYSERYGPHWAVVALIAKFLPFFGRIPCDICGESIVLSELGDLRLHTQA
jgi:hypothetical protein